MMTVLSKYLGFVVAVSVGWHLTPCALAQQPTTRVSSCDNLIHHFARQFNTLDGANTRAWLEQVEQAQRARAHLQGVRDQLTPAEMRRLRTAYAATPANLAELDGILSQLRNRLGPVNAAAPGSFAQILDPAAAAIAAENRRHEAELAQWPLAADALAQRAALRRTQRETERHFSDHIESVHAPPALTPAEIRRREILNSMSPMATADLNSVHLIYEVAGPRAQSFRCYEIRMRLAYVCSLSEFYRGDVGLEARCRNFESQLTAERDRVGYSSTAPLSDGCVFLHNNPELFEPLLRITYQRSFVPGDFATSFLYDRDLLWHAHRYVFYSLIRKNPEQYLDTYISEQRMPLIQRHQQNLSDLQARRLANLGNEPAVRVCAAPTTCYSRSLKDLVTQPVPSVTSVLLTVPGARDVLQARRRYINRQLATQSCPPARPQDIDAIADADVSQLPLEDDPTRVIDHSFDDQYLRRTSRPPESTPAPAD